MKSIFFTLIILTVACAPVSFAYDKPCEELLLNQHVVVGLDNYTQQTSGVVKSVKELLCLKLDNNAPSAAGKIYCYPMHRVSGLEVE